MKKYLFFLFLLAFAQYTTYAQRSKPDKIKYGKIAPEDLAMTQYAPDTAAAAVVLADVGSVMIEAGTVTTKADISTAINGAVKDYNTTRTYQYRYTRLRRVKLLKKSAFQEYGTASITYYDDPNDAKTRESFEGLKAQAIQPDGSEINLKSKDFLEEKLSKNIKKKTIVFSNLKEGSIVEYRYEIVSPNLYYLRGWEFQDFIPTRYSEYSLTTIENINFKILPRRLGNVTTLNDDPSLNLFGESLTGRQTTYIADNVVALKDEPFVNNVADYRSRLDVQLEGYRFNGTYENVSETWQQIAFNIYESNYFGKQIENKSNHNDILAAAKPTISETASPEEKMVACYNFINKNIKWRDGDFDYNTSKDLDDAFNAKIASSGELNLMLLALLRNYQITADPVLISTQSHGYPYVAFPNLRQFDHTIVKAKIGEKDYWLDAGNPFRPINVLRIASLNTLGWLAKKENPQWINISPINGSKTISNTFKINNKGELSGVVASSFAGYTAAIARSNYDKKKETIEKEWIKIFPTATIDSLKAENWENTGDNFKLNYRCNITNNDNAENAAVIYVPLPILSECRENLLKAETRQYDINLPFPTKNQYIINLEIPEGYTVESLPKGAVVTLPENGGKFQYLANQNGNNIQIIIKVQVQQTIFAAEEYKTIQEFYRLIADKFQEQIVLKKI